MKKAIALAMASVMAAGLLAGCGGSAANSTAASSEAASSEAASTSTEAATEAHTVNTTDPITLTISWWGGDARQAAYEAACKAFTEKYPNITVECTYGPWNGWGEAPSTCPAARPGQCPGCRHRCRRDAGQLELAVPVLRQGSELR